MNEFDELFASITARENATNKVNAWCEELFPEALDVDCSDADGFTALRFSQSASDALGQSRVIFPKIMVRLEVDQVDDVAIYYGLKKAMAYRRANFPGE